MTQDEQHLNLLSIFHYVLGGITALFSCLPFIHVGTGLLMVFGKMDANNPPPPAVGWFFVILGSFFILFGWVFAINMLLVGRKLKQRKSFKYCLVVAAIECIMMPFGTILGVFTLVVLMKEPVKQLFESKQSVN